MILSFRIIQRRRINFFTLTRKNIFIIAIPTDDVFVINWCFYEITIRYSHSHFVRNKAKNDYYVNESITVISQDIGFFLSSDYITKILINDLHSCYRLGHEDNYQCASASSGLSQGNLNIWTLPKTSSNSSRPTISVRWKRKLTVFNRLHNQQGLLSMQTN